MSLGCFWLSAILPPSSTPVFCNSPTGQNRLNTYSCLCKTWKQTGLETDLGEKVQWAGEDYRPPRTSSALQPLWPPTGRWQIHALLPAVTVCGCGISRESFGGLRRGNNIQRFMVLGAAELSGSRGNGWCDAGSVWQRVSGRLSSCFPTNKSPGALYGRQGLGWCVGSDVPLVPFSSFDHSWNTSLFDILLTGFETAAPTALICVWPLWELSHSFSVHYRDVRGSKYLCFLFQMKC